MLQPLRLKMSMLRFLATEIFAQLDRRKNGILRLLRLKMGMMRLCATEETFATLHDPNPKKICCDFVRPKTDILRLCATQKR